MLIHELTRQWRRAMALMVAQKGWLFILLGMALLAAWPALAQVETRSPAAQVAEAWQQASAAGRFQFETNTEQTIHPTTHPANIGRRARSKRFDVDGAIDRTADSITIQLWPYGRSRANSLTIKQENGRTVGRAGAEGEWTEVADAAELFLQNSRPLSFLSAADNVRLLSGTEADSLFPEALLPDKLEAAVTRYRFELDGLKYAQYMRDMMEAELRERGELPPGVSLGMVQQFVDMKGEGELWLNANGLPYYQVLHVQFPAGDNDLEWVEATITTGYSGWERRFADLAALDWRQPTAALAQAAAMSGFHPANLAPSVMRLGYAVLLLGLVLLLFGRYARQARAATSLLIIASMLAGPLLQVAGAAAFTERQAARVGASASGNATSGSEPQPESDIFRPHQDPMLAASVEPAASDLPGIEAAVPPAAPVSPQRVSEATACTVSESSDCDGDNLEDKVEIFELGTFADEVDSDGDGISDNLEVAGFSAGGETWYLNPRNPDSNQDGQPDGLECPARRNINDDGTIDSSVSAVACPDTDGDGAPDVWDYDNDGDGVPDTVDSDPGSFQEAANQKVDLSLSGYQTGEPLFVEVAVRPTDDGHLWFANNYLDWPDLDQQGQIMRVTTDTLGTDGDIMISPLLEVTIPYSSSNPSRGLPVKDGVNAASIGKTDPMDDWLDTDTLSLYGITANMDGDDGAMVLYAPLALTRDIVGETPVALSTQLYYEMPAAASGWGSDHQMRLLWSVNGIADQCTLPEGETWASYCDVGSDRSNTTNLSHWTTTQTVFQTYYDDFTLTSLSVREEVDVNAAVIAQKQGASGASNHYENYLWHMAETLEETFLAGQLINGQRMSVADIGSNYSNWGIPAAALYFDQLNVSSTTDMQDQLTGDSVITLLDQIYSGSSKPGKATLLFVGDRTFRSVGLEQTGSTALDLSGVDTVTTGFMRWSPYSYSGATWSNLDLQTYLAELGSDLTPVFTDGEISSLGGGSGYDVDDARAGAINLAESFYASVYSGAITLVAQSSTLISSGTLDNSAHVLSGEAAVNITAELLDMVQDYYTRISLSNLSLTATLFAEIEAVATSAWTALSSSRGLILEALGQVVNGELATSHTVALGQLQYAPLITGNLSQLLNASALDYAFRSTIGEAQEYGGLAESGVLAYYSSYRLVYKLYSAYRRFTGNVPTVSRLLSGITESYRVQLFIGYAVEVGEAIGSFVYAWGSGKITPGSPEFAEKLAYEIAVIIVDTILLIIAIVATGGIVLGVLALVTALDSLAAVICAAVGVKPGSEVDQWVCGGLTGALEKAITYVINDYTPLVDLTRSGRLDNNLSQPTLTQNTSTPGYAVGNTINITAGITSTLYFGHPNWMGYLYAVEQLTDENLKAATFAYQLQSSPADINLNLNGTNWDFIGGSSTFANIPSGARYRGSFVAPINYLVPADDAGVNSGLSVSMAEGFAMYAQDCWLVIFDPVCGLETWRDTNQTDLSSDLIFDLFPETIDGFHALALVDQDSYHLGWDDSFPTLADADGDGVRSKLAGGADPNDSDPDSDGDGLNDGFEQNYGFDPTEADADGDGLTDYWEAYFLTDPNEADTDGDGLLDSEEAFHPNWIYPYENSTRSNTNPPANAPQQSFYAGGWEIVYDYSGSTPLKTWVSASPTDPDSDDDSIDDLREQIYGYNPLAASTLNVLSLKSQVAAVESGTTYPVPFATLSSSLDYSATVENELTDRWALGLLQTEYPEDTVRATQEMGILQPLGSTSLSGSQSAGSGGLSGSGTTNMVVRAGAIVEGDDDRVLWLRMNEAAGAKTLTDSSVYNHDVSCTYCPAANGSYWNFTPTSTNGQAVLVEPTDALAATSFTLGVWVKIVSPGTVTLYDFMSGGSGPAEDNFSLRLNNNAVEMVVQRNSYATPETIPTGEWTHLLVTYDQSSTQTTLYVNGIQKWQQNTATIIFGDLVFNIEVGSGNAGTHFEMDELELFNRVLSTAEIEQLFGLPVLDVDFKSLQDNSPSNNSLSCTSGTNCPSTSASGAYFDQKSFVHASGSALDFSGDRFTFSAWIKPETRSNPFDNNAVSAYNGLTGAPPRTASSTYDWQGVFGETSATNTDSMGPSLYVNPAGQMRMAMGGGSSVCHVDTAEGLIQYGSWQHVIVSYDGSNFSFYVNGNKVAESSDACASITAGALGNLQIGRASKLGTLYFNKVTFFSGDDDGSAFDIRINFDGDSTANNIWSGEAPDDTQDPFTINAAHYIPSDSSHTFRFWQDDKSPSTEYQECTIGCDDSYVFETVHNVDLGAASQTFDYNKGSNDFASGKLEWSISNDFFQGSISEFKAYTRTFSDEDALNLYESSYSGLYFNFDEPPGADSFADVYDSNVVASCDYAGGTCPDSGTGGIANQAGSFDGDDYLALNQVDLLTTLTSDFTIAAWVRPDSLSGFQRIFAAERNNSNNGFGFGLSGNKLLFTTFNHKDYQSSATLTEGEWQHVAVVFDGPDNILETTYRAAFYLNGNHVDTIVDNVAFGQVGSTANSDDPYRIGSSTQSGTSTTNEAFHGKIDDLVVEARELNQNGIQKLMENAPLLNLHLDEDLYTTSFVDDSRLGNDAACSGSACPGAGNKGQIREAAVFDGDDYLTVPTAADLSLDQFTVSLWVNPTEIKSDYQPLLVRENPTSGSRNYGIFIHPGSMDLNFGMSNSACSAFEAQTAFNNPLLQHQWNHVVFTYDGTVERLYINGTQRRTHSYSGTPCTTNNPVYIGGKPSRFTPLSGSIDEVTIHGRALSAFEVAQQFAYQSAWFDVKETHTIVIDDDNPTVSLDRATPYIAPGETVFKINAQDATSDIVRVDYGISGYTGELHATNSNGVWTFSYNFEYEGTYSIVLAAWDSVGNLTTVVEQLKVDTQAPTGITGSLPPHKPTDGIIYWSNIIVDDTASTVDANSGIDDSSVMVTVRDRLGNIVGAPVKARHDRSDLYSAQIPFAFDPYGEYFFTVSFKDNVGHLGSFTQPVYLESTGPHADVMLQATTTITPGMTLRGVASDVEHIWQSRALQLHFEDGVGATSFLDTSANEFVANCASSATCPTVEESGKYEDALSFDGSNDVLTLADNDAVSGASGVTASLEERLGIVEDSFTIMSWVNASSLAGFRPLLGTSPFEDDQELFVGFIGGAPVISYGSHSAGSAETLPTGEWHHVAWRYDMDERELAIFIDGELVNTQPNRNSYTGTGNTITIGQADPTQLRFAGLVDELAVYGIALTNERIYDIANPVQSGLSDIDVRFRHIDDQGQAADSGMWYEATFDSGSSSSIFRTWQIVVPSGLSGSYKIDLRATDNYGVTGPETNSVEHHDIPHNERFVPGVWAGTIGSPTGERTRYVFMPILARGP